MFQGMSDRVGAEIDAYIEVGMPPDEYRWLELVYERWRGALRRAGSYPTAVRAAALEVETAAALEKTASCAAASSAWPSRCAPASRSHRKAWPRRSTGCSLARIDEIERYSMDDLAPPDDDGAELTEGSMMSEDDIKAELARLKEENERLKARQSRAVSLKVSEKGGLSVYGLGRFPVTLYKEQWTKLLDMADDIRAFLKENDSRLKSKS